MEVQWEMDSSLFEAFESTGVREKELNISNSYLFWISQWKIE